MKRSILASAVLAAAIPAVVFAFSQPVTSGTSLLGGARLAASPEKGNGQYISFHSVNGAHVSLLFEPQVAGSAPYEHSNSEGLLARGVRLSTAQESATMILLAPNSDIVKIVRCDSTATVEAVFDPPIMIGDGWRTVITGRLQFAGTVEYFGVQRPAKGGSGETLVVH